MDVAVEMPKPKVTERVAWQLNGWPVAGLAFVLLVAGVVLFSVGAADGQGRDDHARDRAVRRRA